jgi:hypothetical protein
MNPHANTRRSPPRARTSPGRRHRGHHLLERRRQRHQHREPARKRPTSRRPSRSAATSLIILAIGLAILLLAEREFHLGFDSRVDAGARPRAPSWRRAAIVGLRKLDIDL